MKTIAASLFLALIVVSAAFGQAETEKRVIEVSGSAEQMIIPNEFTFKITLAERIENKRKITIEEQETSLGSQLTAIGVDVAKDLSIYDMSSTYFRTKKLKDVLGTKDYSLKIRDLNKIAQLQDLADRINIAKLDLISTDNTDMVRYRRETKIAAIKAAKDKAQYLLEAIGARLGRPVYIDENAKESGFVIDGQEVSNYRSGALNSNNNIPFNLVKEAGIDNLSFSATKIRYEIVAEFEIE